VSDNARLPAHRSRRMLDAVGFGSADSAALHAFAVGVPADLFENAFAARYAARRGPEGPPSAREALFFSLLLERRNWIEPEWLEALAGAWDDCLQSGSLPALLPMAGAMLVDAVRDALCGEAVPAGRAEWDILTAAGKLAQAILARLSLDERRDALEAVPDADPVTGLPTRRHFAALLDGLLRAPEKKPLGVLLLHLDWGASGHHLLVSQRDGVRRSLTAAMRRKLRPEDVLCVIGDQEWALLLPDLRSSAQILLAAQRLVETCDSLSENGFPNLRRTTHVGGAQAPEDGDSVEALEHAARAALHEAIRLGVPVAAYRPAMVASMEYELALEQDVARAMIHPPFEVWLQPKIALATGRCDSAEALLRWRRNGSEWVPPPRLVETASRLGLMPALSRWLLAQVVRMISEFDAAQLRIRIALNLVAQDLHDEDLPQLVAQTLATWRVDPQRLSLEVTEGALIADRERAAAIIERLRAFGCNVALDDFGTGFSSMSYLRDLPVSELKIDQLFIRDMLHSPRDHAIVAAVQALARGFGMAVVAEGVEDQATSDELQRLGCDYAQGFLYATAMPQREFAAWVRARNAG